MSATKKSNAIEKKEKSFFDRCVTFLKPHKRFFDQKKVSYIIRNVKFSDFSELNKIEEQCWSKSRSTDSRVIKDRISVYPDGQFVMEKDGAVIGAIYSQRIKSMDQLKKMRTDTAWDFHDGAGSIIQLLGVSVLPKYQGYGFGDELIEHLLNHCREIKDITTFIGVSFCKHYHKQTDKKFEEYIYLRDRHGFIKDPVLRFHERHGGKVGGILKGYRPDDNENEGCGVLIVYDIYAQKNSLKENEIKKLNSISDEEDAPAPEQKENVFFLERLIKSYLGPEKEGIYSEEIPLMEMGLDSADLLSLRDQLNSHYKVCLETVFFFEYNNIAKINKYFKDQHILIEKEKISEGAISEEKNKSQKKLEKKVVLSDQVIKQSNENDIAIIGMACRLPGEINDCDSLWSFLKAARSAIGTLPEGRWNWPSEFDLNKYPGIDKGGFLKNIANFDAELFRISPKEAKTMDPQQRFMLELTWEVLERAGYSPSRLSQSSTGVFIGASGSDYQRVLDQSDISVEAHSGLGSSMAILANRISYFYDFRGPSLCIDTACSSSLVALYEAVESLKQGKCEQALVGGIHIMCHPNNSLAYYKAGMLSPEGMCRPFDEKANGYVRSEGAVLLLIKPLKQAIEQGDKIDAVIKSVACNHGGQATGLTVPNPKQQAALLKEACVEAYIDPESIGYIEAHGTGTPLGDPIEISGIKEAYGYSQGRQNDSIRCLIGSIKSNFGHLEAAAGLVGLLKVVLSLQHQEIIKTVHFKKLNPHINLEGTFFSIADQNQEWQVKDGKRRIAGLSSFGSGGTNAHAIIEEYVSLCSSNIKEPKVSPVNPVLIILSAKNNERLKEYAQKLLTFIQQKQERLKGSLYIDELAYTLQVAREPMEERLGIITNSVEDLIEKLANYIKSNKFIENLYVGKVNKNTTISLPDDYDTTLAIDKWINEKNYSKILEFWIRGININWSKFYGEKKPSKINLPTYPFAKDHHWIKISSSKKDMQPVLLADTYNNILPAYNSVILDELSEHQVSLKDYSSLESNSSAMVQIILDEPSKSECETLVKKPKISKEQLEKELKGSLAEALYMKEEDIYIDKPFIEMGLDSIIGVEWIKSINKRYGITLAATKVYDYPNIRTFREFLQQELLKVTSNLSDLSLEKLDSVEKSTMETQINLDFPEKLDAQNKLDKKSSKMKIAIIGISGRYPDAPNLVQFWSNLATGQAAVREVPKERWNMDEYYNPDTSHKGKIYCKQMGSLSDIDQFDPLFFMISPADAEDMDPQHRLFLEEGYKAFEDAGYSTSILSGQKCGVYVGIMSHEYEQILLKKKVRSSITGSSYAIGAARLSYYLNLKGPAIAVDTACSSSLVATHLACQALYSGEINMALVGGVTLYLTPESYIGMCEAGMLSKDGKCKTFDNNADGFVPGEGVGALVLKRLEDAERDEDKIYGVIIGSGLNQDGKTNGITAPSVNSQIELERDIYTKYKIHPESIQYIETHGTGTKLGDPIELEALSTVFKEKTICTNYCALASVKSNIGHTSAAAGVASIHKVLLSLSHKKIAPTLNFKTPNIHFDFENSPFYVNRELRDWKVQEGKARRAAVSSFGFSGTNAHLVIEEYPKTKFIPLDINEESSFLIVLSAKNNDRLKEYAQKLLFFIQQKNEDEDNILTLSNIAYTLQVGREPMEERLGIVASSLEEVKEKLTQYLAAKELIEGLHLGQVKKNKDVIEALNEDAEFLETVEKWIKNRKFSKLLAYWTKGLNIDWSKLYGKQKPKRISLPTYPFAKERYWISDNNKEIRTEQAVENKPDGLVEKVSRVLDNSEAIETLYFETTLEKKPLIARSEITQESKQTAKTIVCFLSNLDQKLNLSNEFKGSSFTNIVFISQGDCYEKRSSYEYQIISTDKETYQKALSSIKEEYKTINTIIYLWVESDAKWIKDVFPIITIIQNIAELFLKTAQLLLVGSFKHELDYCYLESWIGITRSLSFILPSTKANVILHHQTPDKVWNWGAILENELAAENSSDVLYREGERYEYGIQPTTLSLEKESPYFKKDGRKKTILITGGCGAIGFEFAKHLALTQQVNLILSGRSLFNSKIERQLKELEKLGGSAIYIEADSCDSEAMKEGVNQAKLKFGSIHGIIHAAGIESKKTILEKSFLEFKRVLGPKIQGTQILDEVLKEEPLDFICYFSSSSAILGDFGSCDYAMGNRFEMAYANYRNELTQHDKSKGRAIVINWPLWKEGGMGIDDTTKADFYIKTSGQDYLDTKQALKIFDKLISQNKDQLLVVVGYPSRVNQFLGITQTTSLLTKSESININGTFSGRRIEMRGLSLDQCVILDLKKIASQILKISSNRLEEGDNLADFGFDSISLAEFAREIGRHYSFEISPSVFFGHSTISSLTEYFLKAQEVIIQEFYQEDKKDQQEVESKFNKIDSSFKETIDTGSNQVVYKKKEKAINLDHSNLDEPIAIIGMSGRFPDARNVDEMWEILRDGKEAVHEIPLERFDWREYYGDSSKDREKTNCKWSGMIPGAAEFDPLFFEISPKEAQNIDPRHRHLLQESWKALEDAAYGDLDLKRQKIGMFVGVEEGDYSFFVKKSDSVTSAHNGILAARLAYFLNLKGAVMSINTACSSSLVALHQACIALKTREIDTAIVAGVNMFFTPEMYVSMSQAGMLSPDGTCYAFDERANGMVPGEAVAVVVLKRLSDAERDRDPIKAIIRGSGINYDGKTNGITAPNGVAQKELLLSIYEKNHIHPGDIEYVVAHGTGTPLGDPVEINALNEILKTTQEKSCHCALTSTKTNFGHACAASGLVSLISLVKALQEETIPGSLYCEKESSYIDWENSPLYVNKANKAWPVTRKGKYGDSRIGAVSSFGMSGTNAHVVVQGYLHPEIEKEAKLPYYILTLSAKTPSALIIKIEEMIEALEKSNISLAQVSYTLQEGRHHFKYRCALVTQDKEGALYGLKQLLNEEKHPMLFTGEVPREFKGQKAFQDYIITLLDRCFNQENNSKDQISYKDDSLALADLYCQGYDIDWSKLYGGEKPKKISLPTYPFAREKYWIETHNTSLVDIKEDVFIKEERQSIYLKREWKNKDINLLDNKIDTPILVLCTENQGKIFDQIQAVFQNAIILKSHEIDKWISVGSFFVGGVLDIRSLDLSLTSSLDQTIILLQKLIKESEGTSLRLIYFSQLESNPNELAGLFEMLQSEYGYVTSRHVILENNENIGKIISNEWITQQFETTSKYESGTRYVPILNSLVLNDGRFKPSEDDVVWITGGTRGIGRLTAQYLAEKYHVKKIVLHGITSFPTRDNWDSLDLSNDIKEKIAAIRKLEAMGVTVWVTSVPLTNLNLLEEEVKRVNNELGNIEVVVHAAGVADKKNPAFIYKTKEDISLVLAPKSEGLKNLDLAMKGQKLKRFVIYSSVSALMPSLASGQSDYAMANSYMDQWVRKKHRQGKNYYLSIQWPSWKESGMGEVKTEAYKKTGVKSHTDQEGLMLLDTCLKQTSEAVIFPGIIDPNNFDERVLMFSKITLSKDTKNLVTPNVENNKLSQYISISLIKKTTLWIQNVVSKFLKIEISKIDKKTTFQEIGVDSIILAQMVKELDNLLVEISLDPSIILEYPTIEQLVKYLLRVHCSSIERYFERNEGDPIIATHTPQDREENISLKTLETPITSLEKKDVTVTSSSPIGMADKIAVIGMACHFPGADNLASYWNNLANGIDCIKEVPKSRWNVDQYYSGGEYKKGYSISRWGAFLESIEDFDPHYFGITEDLANQMDPLAKQWLEVSAEALADAGFERKSLWGEPIGVFVGTRVSNFSQQFEIEDIIKDVIVGLGQNFIGAHVSHFYNFKGPNMIIDAACASALTAIHQAVKSLLIGESKMALAGGVDILLDEEAYLKLSRAHILSPDGRCKAFDESANGIGLGEGCGVLVLKRFRDAINDGNKIYGVIEGTAINNDGNTMGITTPNPEAQRDLIQQTINIAGVNPESISYIEAHGTGTLIGDPIELKALTEVFRRKSALSQYCGVGSVKSNIGHLLSAAGAAGIIKILLSMVHRQLPPTLHCHNPNPRFNFKESPFYPVLKLQDWPNEIRRAGISSFGLGGNNAHIILSDAEIPENLRAILEPRSPLPKFQRKRYWPTRSLSSKALETKDLSYLFEQTKGMSKK